MTKYHAKPTDSKGCVNWDDQENETWNTLITRQINTVAHRACPEFIAGLDALQLSHDTIPQLPELNKRLEPMTGWRFVPVSGTVLVPEFFAMLSRREFPVATFIRTPEELDYLQQPDIFHELFGHGPLLTHLAYADFVQWYGEFAGKLSTKQQKILSRLFWFTIEFGLTQSPEGLRIYGGGILSSHQETVFALEDPRPARNNLDIIEVLQTPYEYDHIQEHYFITHSLEQFYNMMDENLLLQALEQINQANTKTFNIC